MGARVTATSAENYVKEFGDKIIQLYRDQSLTLALDKVETDGEIVWGRISHLCIWLPIAQADEEMVYWLDSRNVTPPDWGTKDMDN